VTRLGEGIEATGAIAPAAVDRTAQAISRMTDTARKEGVRAVAAVGTAGMRIASNTADVVDEIRSRAGITVEVISGEEESRLAFLAVQTGLDTGSGNLVVFDTGGGSSQFTIGKGSDVAQRFSVNVGAVAYTETFELDQVVSAEVIDAALNAISADLVSLDEADGPFALIAMGGAVTNMTSVMHGLAQYDPEVIHGSKLARSEIARQVKLYASMDADQRRSIVGLQPGRAEVILAGACIVGTVMDKLAVDSATVSDRGLRHGVMAERFGL
jgi:exopolyphosphatase/guanosine-5'-triphosphate,3'-diphosphate pyrophosphatase